MTSATQRALVADDDPVLRQLLTDILGMLEVHAVVQADNGVDAIALFDTMHPDVVVLDVLMPGLSGLDVLQHIRQKDPRTQVVILTADNGFDIARRSMAFGATCYLRKNNSAQSIYGLLAQFFLRDEAGNALVHRAPAQLM